MGPPGHRPGIAMNRDLFEGWAGRYKRMLRWRARVEATAHEAAGKTS